MQWWVILSICWIHAAQPRWVTWIRHSCVACSWAYSSAVARVDAWLCIQLDIQWRPGPRSAELDWRYRRLGPADLSQRHHGAVCLRQQPSQWSACSVIISLHSFVITCDSWLLCAIQIVLLGGGFLPSVLWRCWLGCRKGIRPEWWGAGLAICLERGAGLHMAQRMPLPLTVSCFSKIQIGFTLLVPYLL